VIKVVDGLFVIKLCHLPRHIIPFLFQSRKKISFHGDLIIDDKVYNDIHGECTFLANESFWFQYDNLTNLNYKIYDSKNKLLFEFHSDFAQVDDNNISHIHQNISDISFIK
jgi:hypothetical protein